MPADCSVLRTHTILPDIRICGIRPFDPGIILCYYCINEKQDLLAYS